MAGDDETMTREEAVYAAIFAFLKRNGFSIALLAPLVVITLLPVGPAGIVLVPIIYLVEAIAYAGLQRRRGVRPADPVTAMTSAARWTWRLLLIVAFAIVTMILTNVVERIGG